MRLRGFRPRRGLEALLFAIACMMLLAQASCGHQRDPQASTAESPDVRLLRAAGFALPVGAQTSRVFSTTVDGHVMTIVHYQAGQTEGVQIVSGSDLVTEPKIAYDVLLGYAWVLETQQASADLKTVSSMVSRLQQARERYAAVFAMSEALDPILETVDRLKDRPIYGVPRLEVRGVTLFEVNNVWDAICWLPVDAANLCLLEIPFRKVRDEGLEVQQLLKATSDDLSGAQTMLQAAARGEVPDAVALKQQIERARSSLNNLARKMDQLAQDVAVARQINQHAIDRLDSSKWPVTMQRLAATLLQVDPVLDVRAIATDLQGKLRRLDGSLGESEHAAQGFLADVQAQQEVIERLQVANDRRLRSLRQMWTIRPGSAAGK